MKLSISNLAWDRQEDEAVASLLRRYGWNTIDLVPGKYFGDFHAATEGEIAAVRSWWESRGIGICGMQSLLFGTTGLNVFGNEAVRRRLLSHLDSLFRLASGLGAPRLVFGSPKNRDRSGLTDAQALDSAVDFFRRAGNLAQDRGVLLCLEPNPVRYACNFMVDSHETLRVVRAVDHPSIRMQLDVGAMSINGEVAGDIIAAAAPWVGHIHASEPDLAVLGGPTHQAVATALRQALPQHTVTVEMLATSPENHLDSIERALRFADAVYGEPK